MLHGSIVRRVVHIKGMCKERPWQHWTVGADGRPEAAQLMRHGHQDTKSALHSHPHLRNSAFVQVFPVYLATAPADRQRAEPQFMAQICITTAIKHYLPKIFIALGLSKEIALIASAIESTLKMGLSIL